MGDHSESAGIEIGGSQHLVQLHFLLLQKAGKANQLPLQQQVLETSFLLHLVNGFGELLVQVIALVLNLWRQSARQHPSKANSREH